jgi:hypothetical protein
MRALLMRFVGRGDHFILNGLGLTAGGSVVTWDATGPRAVFEFHVPRGQRLVIEQEDDGSIGVWLEGNQ